MTTLREKVRLLIERDTLQPADSWLLDAIVRLVEQEREAAWQDAVQEMRAAGFVPPGER